MTFNSLLSKRTTYKTAITFIVSIYVIFAFSGCSASKQRGQGDLAETKYCKAYITFENKVATAKAKEQLKLLKKIVDTKDFPDDPSLRSDYELVIRGYEKAANGEDVISQENQYEKAIKRINRHAVEHCDTLKSKSGVSM